MSRTYEFVQLDVFTQTPLAGNPLAIFTDARGLNDGEMQALAREMNLSETTFILPRDPATEARKGQSPHLHCLGRVAFCRAPDARYGAAFICIWVCSQFKRVCSDHARFEGGQDSGAFHG